MQEGTLARRDEDGSLRFIAAGAWDLANAARIDRQLARQALPSAGAVGIDLGAVEAMDTAGAWLIHRTVKQWRAKGLTVALAGASPAQQSLLDAVAESDRPPPPEPKEPPLLLVVVGHVGAVTIDLVKQARDFIGFLGLVVTVLLRTLLQPWRLRLTPLFYHMEKVGLNALPIVGLISFLIGVVIAYQGSSQLRQFGADIYVVNLIAVSVLRELGILLTAIVVAGRSGSAFTAQIGSMKLREEVDAMRTLGLDPVETLVLPRMLGLIITLPLLCFFADILGMMGGAMMAWITLDIRPAVFIERFAATIGIWHFWVGMIKAPFFAALISLVGCYEGLQVTGSAESVGQRTTRSVVESIFLVIVADAAFSIFFNLVGV